MRELQRDPMCGILRFATQIKRIDIHRSHMIRVYDLGKYLPFLTPESLALLISNFQPTPNK